MEEKEWFCMFHAEFARNKEAKEQQPSHVWMVFGTEKCGPPAPVVSQTARHSWTV